MCNFMIDFICMDVVELHGAQRNRKLQDESFLPCVGFEPTTFRLGVQAATSYTKDLVDRKRFKLLARIQRSDRRP